MTDSLAIIPARYASTRFPGKPLALLGQKPMIQWVYERASLVFEHVIVATDDDRIYDAVQGFEGKVVMTATDHKSGTDRCAEAAGLYENESGMTFSYIINIQGDEPLIQKKTTPGTSGLHSASQHSCGYTDQTHGFDGRPG